MWQKARIIKVPTPHNASALGKYIWVQCGPPIMISARGLKTRKWLKPALRYDTNIIPHFAKKVSVRADQLELIAEFAENPERIAWESLLN